MEKTDAMRIAEAAGGRDVRDMILDALDEAGNLTAAAPLLGLSPSGLSRWIERLGGSVSQQSQSRVEFPGFARSLRDSGGSE